MLLENVEANTTTNGSTTKIVRKESASATMMNRIGLGSFSRFLEAAIRDARSLTSCMAGGEMARSAVEAYALGGGAGVTRVDGIDIGQALSARERGFAPSAAGD